MKSLFAVALLAVGCAAAPQPKPAEAPTAPAATASSATAAAGAEPAAAPASGPPSATVEGFSSEGEEMNAKILFANPTATACEFKSYTLVWPGGKKRVDAHEFHIPAGGKRERSLRLHKNDGDMSSLNKDSAHVEIETDCGGGG